MVQGSELRDAGWVAKDTWTAMSIWNIGIYTILYHKRRKILLSISPNKILLIYLHTYVYVTVLSDQGSGLVISGQGPASFLGF